MPDGRFLSRSIAHDWELNDVSLEADYLFARCIPHLDREGRMSGHPGQVKGMAVPLRKELSVEVVDRCLRELAEAGLLLWYEVDGRAILEFPRFDRHQKGLRKNREAESNLPSSKVQKAQRVTTLLRSRSGVGPEYSGSTPASSRPKSSEVKSSEVKRSEVKRSKASSPKPPPSKPADPQPPPEPAGVDREDVFNLEEETRKNLPRARRNIVAIHGGTEDEVEIGGHRVGIGIEIKAFRSFCEMGRDPPEIVAAAIAHLPTVTELEPPISLARWGAEDDGPAIYERCVGLAYKGQDPALDVPLGQLQKHLLDRAAGAAEEEVSP